MDKTIYIHIGPPKTGSTSIQAMLDMSREKLLSKGILYPSSGRPAPGKKFMVERPQGRVLYRGPMQAHHFLAWTIFGEVENLEPDNCWGMLLKEVKDSEAHSIVISAEGFARMTLQQIMQVKQYLEGYQVKVILFIRDPFSRIFSDYTQNVKKGRFYQSFGRYIRQPNEKLFLYDEIIELWGSVFGSKNISINVIGEKHKKYGLEHQFLEILGVSSDEFGGVIIDEAHNPSPAPDVVRILIYINRFEHALGYCVSLRAFFEKVRKYIVTRTYITNIIRKIAGDRISKPLYTSEDRKYLEELYGNSYRSLLEQYISRKSVEDLGGINSV